MHNIVFIINIKNPNKPGRSDVYDLSIDSWRRWCLKNECELFVLDQPVVDMELMNPIFFRHYIFDLLPDIAEEQICMVDADTIIHPKCPNFFNLTEGKYCGVHNDGDYDWIIRSIENYIHEFPEIFDAPFPIWNYINSGFMITNKKFQFVHEWLKNFYWDNAEKLRGVQRKYGVGTDQPLINLITNQLSVPIKVLPYQFNMQDLPRKNILDDRMLFTRIPGVYHFNAIPGGPEVANKWIVKTYKFLYE